MNPVHAANLDAPKIRHGFFTREGGVSEGIFASLNCGLGSGDRQEAVTENRQRVLAALHLAPNRLVTLYQQHTDKVLTVGKDWDTGQRPVADGIAAKTSGFGLGILTADCAPVLFADPEAGVVGAAHAGWRGAFTGILENTVAAMIGLGARAASIRAAIGPCIGQASYQVGPEFVERFTAADLANDRYFSPPDHEGKRHFALAGYTAARLRKLGLASVDASPFDTCAEENRFFSFRRTTLRHEPDYGRQISVIALEGK